MAVPKGIAIFNIVACLATPIAHFTVIIAPCMDGPIADGDLGLATSLTLKVGGFVHIAVDAATNVSYGVSSGKTV